MLFHRNLGHVKGGWRRHKERQKIVSLNIKSIHLIGPDEQNVWKSADTCVRHPLRSNLITSGVTRRAGFVRFMHVANWNDSVALGPKSIHTYDFLLLVEVQIVYFMVGECLAAPLSTRSSFLRLCILFYVVSAIYTFKRFSGPVMSGWPVAGASRRWRMNNKSTWVIFFFPPPKVDQLPTTGLIWSCFRTKTLTNLWALVLL